MIVGIVAFIVVLLASIMIHEAGHFATARAFGMKATEFFVGFGPTLWSRKRGETEYGVKAIPAGGFVKIVGMTDLEEIDPADEPRAFYRQPAWQRAIVLAAGSVMHFVIAFVLLVFVFAVLGTGTTTTTLARVAPCIPSDAAATACAADDPESPARAAGLQPGDTVISYDGDAIDDWDQLQSAIRGSAGREVQVVVDRGGDQETVTLTPVVRERDGEEIGLVGVSPQIAAQRQGPLEALGNAVTEVGNLTVATFQGLAAIPAAIPALLNSTFGAEERSIDGLVGPVGIARLSGEVVEGESPLALRIGSFLAIMAGINVFVGIFNLLPLLPLDGGHLAVLGFERARAAIYRVLGRPDPGRVDLTRLLPAAYLVIALFIGLSVLLLVADVLNPVTLPL
ncbi:MAG TPA: site-2 protease family protein [Actinomycetes bacterium]|nr:site-2 protease family protein [Actinomycetes bacterium]